MLVTIVSAPETDTPVIRKPMSKIIVEDNTKTDNLFSPYPNSKVASTLST